MKIYFYLIFLVLFIFNKEEITISSIEAINMWSYKLFPLLFPTFILSDLLLSSKLAEIIVNKFGGIYQKIFNASPYGLYIFLISMIAGTPTNAKILALLKENKYIDDDEINKILAHSILFNPFLILQFGGFKLLIIIWIANLLTGIILRGKNKRQTLSFRAIAIPFNLTDSINKNINIMLNILGTIIVFSSLITLFPNNIYIKLLVSLIFEITNALSCITSFFNKNIFFYGLAFSLGGISIIMQIKSILKDTSINYKLLIISRLVVACIAETSIIISTSAIP